MVICYLLACIPMVAGVILWGLHKRVVWFELLIGTAAAFATAGIFHLIAVNSMTGDQETWSGQIIHTTFHPTWVEEYDEAVYKTVTKTRTVTRDGKTRTETYTERVFSHYKKSYITHNQHWTCGDTLRGSGIEIDHGTHEAWAKLFGGKVTVPVDKRTYRRSSRLYSGDTNIYVAENKTGYIIPTTQWRSFENRVKAAPSLFSYSKPPESIKLPEYPANSNWLYSDRLVGHAANVIDRNAFDQMNSRLGPTKKVNVIMVSFGPHTDMMMSQYLEAAWVGGRKNDVVITFGGGEAVNKPSWCRVFGWTEKDICKRQIENIVREAEKVDTNILPLIEAEIIANYIIKDWSKFDYITVEPPDWAYLVLLGVMLVTQGLFWFWAFNNGEDKCEHATRDLDRKVEGKVNAIKTKWNAFTSAVRAKWESFRK